MEIHHWSEIKDYTRERAEEGRKGEKTSQGGCGKSKPSTERTDRKKPGMKNKQSLRERRRFPEKPGREQE